MAIKAYSRNSAPPMRWHKFLTYFSFVSAVIGTVNLFSSFEGTVEAIEIFKEVGANGVLLVSVCSLVATAATQVLKAIGGYHLLKSRWLGMKLLMLSWALIVVNSAIYSVVYLSMGDELYSGAVDLMSQAITYAVMLALTVIYYKKRRNFFCPVPVSPVVAKPQVFKPSMADMLRNEETAEKMEEISKAGSEENADKTGKEAEESSVELLMRLQSEAAEETRGKAVDKKQPKVNGILLAVCVCLLGCCAYLGLRAYQANESYKAVVAEYEDMKEQKALADKKAETLRSYYVETREKKNELKEEVDFWEDNAVFAISADEKYHRYGCSHIEEEPAYMYTVRAAIDRGLSPCVDCAAPKRAPNISFQKLTRKFHVVN